jgi:hypothetical protein
MPYAILILPFIDAMPLRHFDADDDIAIIFHCYYCHFRLLLRHDITLICHYFSPLFLPLITPCHYCHDADADAILMPHIIVP